MKDIWLVKRVYWTLYKTCFQIHYGAEESGGNHATSGLKKYLNDHRSSAMLYVILAREVMNEAHIPKIAQELSLTSKQSKPRQTFEGRGHGPFYRPYRKEATGSLDEVAITAVRDRLNQLMELDKRREAILKSLEERDNSPMN